MTPAERSRLLKVLNLLGSDRDGEALGAARAAHRLGGGSWDSIIVPAASQFSTASRDIPPWMFDWRRCATQLAASQVLNDWEYQFLQSLLHRWRGPRLTEKQEQALRDIHKKYEKAA